MKTSEIIFGAIRLPIDFTAIVLAFLAAYFLRPITDLIPGVQYVFPQEQLPPLSEYIPLALTAALFLVILFMLSNLYSLKVTHRFFHEFIKIIFFTTAWILFIIAYYSLIVHALFFSRIALAHIWMFTIFFVTVGRMLIIMLQSFMLKYGIGRRRVLFVGANDIADNFYQILSRDKSYKVIGAIADHRESRKMGTLKIIGTLNELRSIVEKRRVEEIIQADPNVKAKDANDLLNFCKSHQINYHFIPDLLKLQRSNVEVNMFDDIPLVSLKQTSLDGWGKVYKRIFDILFSLVAVIILIPVWIIFGILIKLDSKGPIIYKSKRQYRDKIFNMYKFRSMTIDADEKRADLIKNSDREGPLFKMKNDPRVTRLGRFLRRTSIDELPQIFNVLIGNMSLVGPRPHLPEEVEKYASHHYQVFAIQPGMSGLAQISGRSNLSFEDEVKYDIFYIENWSLWLDIKIIVKSIMHIFRATGD